MYSGCHHNNLKTIYLYKAHITSPKANFSHACKTKGQNSVIDWMLLKPCAPFPPQTVKVQGNDISHKLQISRVSMSDEGLYECRVTDANYGELKEYKVQAYLKVNATVRRGLKKTSPLHLTDKKPRKSSSALGQDSNGMSSDQRSQSTSTSQSSQSKTVKHSAGSGKSAALQLSKQVSLKLDFNSILIPQTLLNS